MMFLYKNISLGDSNPSDSDPGDQPYLLRRPDRLTAQMSRILQKPQYIIIDPDLRMASPG